LCGFGHLVDLVVENHEIAVLEVEAVQFVASAFGVENILVNDECSALGVGCNALADLAGGILVSDVEA
jgi:hypothetical protein